MERQNGVGTGPDRKLRHVFEGRVTKALAGVNQYLPAGISLFLNGKAMTTAEITAELQDTLQLFKDLRDLRAQAAAQHKAVRNGLVPKQALFIALERAVQAYLGKGNPLLGQFGFSVGDRKPPSGATLVKGQAKARLTRALRHTMGPKQKAAIRAVAPAAVTVSADGVVRAVEAPPVQAVDAPERASGP